MPEFPLLVKKDPAKFFIFSGMVAIPAPVSESIEHEPDGVFE
jgi:hypothetical protein